MNTNQALFSQVGEEDSDDSKREVEVGRQVGDGNRKAAEPEHAQVLVLQLAPFT